MKGKNRLCRPIHTSLLIKQNLEIWTKVRTSFDIPTRWNEIYDARNISCYQLSSVMSQKILTNNISLSSLFLIFQSSQIQKKSTYFLYMKPISLCGYEVVCINVQSFSGPQDISTRMQMTQTLQNSLKLYSKQSNIFHILCTTDSLIFYLYLPWCMKYSTSLHSVVFKSLAFNLISTFIKHAFSN